MQFLNDECYALVVRRMFIKITSTISSIVDENLANVQFLTFMRVETPEKIQ